MLHPKDDINLSKYGKKFKYECRKEIAKIKQPYLYKKDFSFKIRKPCYFDSR